MIRPALHAFAFEQCSIARVLTAHPALELQGFDHFMALRLVRNAVWSCGVNAWLACRYRPAMYSRECPRQACPEYHQDACL